MPPTSVKPRRAGSGVCIKITPECCADILRAAARAVMNCDRVYVITGKAKLSTASSISGMPWIPCCGMPIALKEMST
jgi:hypothetical protein